MNRCTKILALSLLAGGILLSVPATSSAFTLQLLTTGAGGNIGAAYFEQVNPQSTGTGVIDPFVRIQKSNKDGLAYGFNTDFRPLQGDLALVNTSAQFTHSLKVNEFGIVSNPVTGENSIRVLLDINQTGSEPYLSLDELKIFTADAPNLGNNASLFAENLVYDMGAANKIYLNYSLNAGSGSGDMLAYLPVSLFSGLGDKYFYLYSKFGATGIDGGISYYDNDGYEEWARIDGAPPVQPVPEPATLLLLGGGLLGGLAARRRRR